jgi:hypothetical protein
MGLTSSINHSELVGSEMAARAGIEPGSSIYPYWLAAFKQRVRKARKYPGFSNVPYRAANYSSTIHARVDPTAHIRKLFRAGLSVKTLIST